MASVTVDVDVDLSDFDDDEILEAAAELIEAYCKKTIHQASDYQIERIRALLTEDDESLPPPSTAAKIKTMSDFFRWQEEQKEKA